LKKTLADKDSGVRYWAGLGVLMRGKDAVTASRAELERAMSDESPSVRIVAAQALGQFGSDADAKKSLDVLLPLADTSKNGYWVCVEALNAIDSLGQRARPALSALNALPDQANVVPKLKEYVSRLLEKIKADLQ
jgi:HEAT repeat protein